MLIREQTRQNILNKNIYSSKNFSESIHIQCYNMYKKIRTESIMRIEIAMVTFKN